MNEQDQDRLRSRMRNQSVVNIAAYRSAAESAPNTSSQYLDPVTTRWIALAVFFLALFFFFARV